MRCLRVAGLLALGSIASSCASPDGATDYGELGPFLDSLMAEAEVPGLGFALFNAEGLLFQHVGGFRSQVTLEPVEAGTTFEAASISKPVFAHMVYSLAREGVLDLDASLETLVPEVPELAHDPRVGMLTPRILLTHQGGLPNWRSRLDFAAQSYAEMFPPGDTLRFVAEPGTEYRYSGEGYVLLQRIVEQITGKGLNELATERVFSPLRMTRSSFLLDDQILRNYSQGHDGEGNPDKWRIHLPLASSTLQTTARDLGRFGADLASQILSEGPYSALAIPAVTVDTSGGVELGWGLGLGIVDDGPRRYVYHGGNNVIFIADFMYGVEEDLGYALLTNSSNGARMIDAVEQRVFGRQIR